MSKVAGKLIGFLVAAALLLGLGVFAGQKISSAATTKTETENSQIVEAVKRTKEVVLLRLAIQGIADQKKSQQLFGYNVPGTSRAFFLKYSYTAMIGVDGSKVNVEKTGNNAYTVTVPKFSFLGQDNPKFSKAVEDNGVISWVTPEVDVSELITKVLNDKAKQQLITDYNEPLQDQCRVFYENIIHAIDPQAKITMKFAD